MKGLFCNLAMYFQQSPISPLDDRDVLGKTFKDLQLHLQDKLNRSFRDNEDKRRNAEKVNTTNCGNFFRNKEKKEVISF